MALQLYWNTPSAGVGTRPPPLHSLTASGAHTGQPREPSLCRHSACKAGRLSAVGCVLGFPSAVLRGSARGAPAQVCVVVWSPTGCDLVPPDTSPQIHACCRPMGACNRCLCNRDNLSGGNAQGWKTAENRLPDRSQVCVNMSGRC